MSKSFLLIDGDGFLFAAACANETVIKVDPTQWVLACNTAAALADTREAIYRVIREVEKAQPVDEVIVYLSARDKNGHYHRHAYGSTYKTNRANNIGPVGLMDMKQALINTANFKTVMIPGMEADDLIGLKATLIHEEGYPFIVCSPDKDLDQIPGVHINPQKLDEGVYTVHPDQAAEMVWYQGLAGDSTDGYSGCPKFGPVTAKKLLDKCTTELELEVAVRKAFAKAGKSDYYALTQMRMSYILQSGPVDGTSIEHWQWPTETRPATNLNYPEDKDALYEG